MWKSWIECKQICVAQNPSSCFSKRRVCEVIASVLLLGSTGACVALFILASVCLTGMMFQITSLQLLGSFALRIFINQYKSVM